MRLINLTAFFFFNALRLMSAGVCLWSGSVGLSVLGVVSLVEFFLSCANLHQAVAVERRASGLWVPAAYCCGLLRVVYGPPGPLLDCGLVLVGILQLYVYWHLRGSFTVNVPSWVCLRDSGPYAFVRHPADALGILSKCVFLLAEPGSINALAVVGASVAAVVSIVAEERFLRERLEYVSYVDKVRFRLIPGVW